MRQYLKYIWALVTLVVTAGCSLAELDNSFNVEKSSNEITVVGRITSFKDCNVETRGIKEGNEAKISRMTMAIFALNDAGTDIGEKGCVYYVPNQESASFTIKRDDFDRDAKYAVYVFANVDMPEYDELSSPTLKELLTKSLSGINTVDIPEKGLPMIGSLGDKFSIEFEKDNQEFILCPKDNNNKLLDPTVDGQPRPILQIPMKALYAKVNFTIEVDASQTVDGYSYPQFTLEGYTVNNVPTQVSFSKSLNNYDDESSNKSINDEPLSLDITGGKIAGGASRAKINFSFYVPERLLAPVTLPQNYNYPFKKGGYSVDVDKDQNGYHDEDDKKRQRFKPRLLDIDANNMKPATNVVISGQYRDHQNHFYDVSYTIYLGADNFGDFNILRNYEYDNIITIHGLQTQGDQLLVDHRVNVEYSQPAKITLLREVLLDSHFEVRPLRIKFNDIGDVGGINAVKVQVVNPSVTNWMRLERSFGDGTPEGAPQTNVNGEQMSIYIDDESSSSSYGKRRFFTYNLIDGKNATEVDATLKESTEAIVPITTDGECVWIYIDECTEVGDGVRSGEIMISYGNLNDDGSFTEANNELYPDVKYVINQRKLFQVIGHDSNKLYNIEYHEEYLHNYDSDESYGQTQYEGMSWGAKNVQFSNKYYAVYLERNEGVWDWLLGLIGIDLDTFMTNILNEIIKSVAPKYDFYLTRDQTALKIPIDPNPEDQTPAGIKVRDYSGHEFSQELIATLFTEENNSGKDLISTGSLASEPLSAVEYCYNKNKRNAKGEVMSLQEDGTWNIDNFKWYLPAIDEIEDIVMSKYQGPDGQLHDTFIRFIDFQNKYYWSSQPAYVYYRIKLSALGQEGLGNAFVDNIGDDDNTLDPGSARATKVSFDATTGYSSVLSGMDDPAIEYAYSYNRQRVENDNSWRPQYEWVINGPTKTLLQTPVVDDGYKSRNDLARVRCVRKMN